MGNDKLENKISSMEAEIEDKNNKIDHLDTINTKLYKPNNNLGKKLGRERERNREKEESGGKEERDEIGKYDRRSKEWTYNKQNKCYFYDKIIPHTKLQIPPS